MIENIVELIAKAHAQSTKSGFWNHDEGCPGHDFKPHGEDDDSCAFRNSCAFRIGVTPSAFCGLSNAKHLCKCENIDPLMKIVLIHSELSEALEEYRLTDEKRGGSLGAILFLKSDGTRSPNDVALDAPASDGPRPRKPEGFVVELADAAIRIFDLLGRLDTEGIFAGLYYGFSEARLPERSISMMLASAHWHASTTGERLQSRNAPRSAIDKLARILVDIDQLAKAVNGDLSAAIQIKMDYNATRAFKHGGKRV